MFRFDDFVKRVGEDPDPRFTLANERTFLAWVTTSLGMLGMGLAIGTLRPGHEATARVIASLWIVLAAALTLRALVRWFRLERAMRSNESLPLSASIPVVALSLGVLALASGLALAGAW